MAPRKKLFFLRYLIVAAIALSVGLVLLNRKTQKNPEKLPVKSMSSWQDADAPLGYSVNGKQPPFDPRFIQLSGFERAAVPTALQVTAPMGSSHGALTYNAQAFWDHNQRRGGHHTGDDLNGIGGMNSDLGDPIFAQCNSLVIYRGEPSSGWGNILLLAHKDREGRIYNTLYSHLDTSFPIIDTLIHRGDQIGTVGTANNNYPAHLHLELRKSSGIHIGAGYRTQQGEYLPPNELYLTNSIFGEKALYKPPMMLILQDVKKKQRDALEIHYSSEP